MAGDGIAIVEMQLPVRIDSHGRAIVHLQIQLPITSNEFNGPQLAVGDLEVIHWRGELDKEPGNSAAMCRQRESSLQAAFGFELLQSLTILLQVFHAVGMLPDIVRL